MRRLLVGIIAIAALILNSLMVQAAKYDFGGRTVRFVFHDATKEGLWGDPVGTAHFEQIEKEFNVKVEVVAMHYDDGSIINDLQQGLLAGTADGVYAVKLVDAYQYAKEGFFCPLTHCDIAPSIIDQFVDPELLKFQGEQYFFNTGATVIDLVRGRRAGFPGEALVWNKTKFEAYGLPNLYELVENGEWTWETFKQIAIEATRDLDGDGVTDIWGYAPYAYPWGFPEAHNWLATNGANVTTVDENGRVVFALDSPAALEALNFYQELHQLGVAYTKEPGYQAISNDKVLMAFCPMWTLFILENHSDELGLVPLPRGPRMDKHVFPAVSGEVYVFAIPATTKENPEALVALARALHYDSPEYIDFDSVPKLIEDAWAMSVRDYESLRCIVDWPYNIAYVTHESPAFIGTNFFYTWNEYNQRILKGESPASVVASFKDTAQAQLDSIFLQQ